MGGCDRRPRRGGLDRRHDASLFINHEATVQEERSLGVVLLMAAMAGAGAGLCFGAAQWLVLRRHAERASRWIWIHVPAWALAMSAIFLGASLPASGSSSWFIALTGAQARLPQMVRALIHGLARPAFVRPEVGAIPVLRLAAHPDLSHVTGRFFDRCHLAPDVADPALAQKFWAACEDMTGELEPSESTKVYARSY